MTLGLDHFRYFLRSGLPSSGASGRAVPPLDLRRLGARDLADLNLPDEVASRLGARHNAEELRRRVFP